MGLTASRRRSATAPPASAQAGERRRVELARRRLAADDPGERLRVRDVEQTLELAEFGLAHSRQICVREPAHHQIHLPHAAAPGANEIASGARRAFRCVGAEPDM